MREYELTGLQSSKAQDCHVTNTLFDLYGQ